MPLINTEIIFYFSFSQFFGSPIYCDASAVSIEKFSNISLFSS